MISVLLSACAGQTNFKSSEKNSTYTKTIDNDLLIVFEISHLRKAMSGNASTARSAANAVVSRLALEVNKDQAAIASEVIDSTTDRTQLPLALSKHKSKKQVLIIQADSFTMVQRTYNYVPQGEPFWGGGVTWSLHLFDMDKAANPSGKAVWIAKTEAVQFGTGSCIQDQYKTCAERFVNAIVYQLKNDGLLKQ